ncbi:MAG: hypothetical protein ABXS92_07435 [Sulfurimonas sp.]
MVKKILFAVLVTWFALLALMPKTELYYKLEEELETKGIKIAEGKLEESIFSLQIKDARVYVRGVKVADIRQMNFFTLFFYSSLQGQGVNLDALLKRMAPQHTENLAVAHSIFLPTTLLVRAKGDFGQLEGEAGLKERKVHLRFIEAEEINRFRSKLKKDEKGWYYETSF